MSYKNLKTKKNYRKKTRLSHKGSGFLNRMTGNYGSVTRNLEKLFRKNSDILKLINFLNKKGFNITKDKQMTKPEKVYQNVHYKKTMSLSNPDRLITNKYSVINDYIKFRKSMLSLFENYKKYNTYIESNGKKHWDSGLSPIKPGEKDKIIPNYGNNEDVNNTRFLKFCYYIDKSLSSIRSKKFNSENFNNNFYYDMMHKLAKQGKFFDSVDLLITFIKNTLTRGKTYYDRHKKYPRFNSKAEAKDARSRRIGEMSDSHRCKYVKCARVGSEWEKANPLPTTPSVNNNKKTIKSYKSQIKKYENCKSKLAKENKKYPRTDSRPEIPKFCNPKTLLKAQKKLADMIGSELLINLTEEV